MPGDTAWKKKKKMKISETGKALHLSRVIYKSKSLYISDPYILKTHMA
jgi:hypothetical protein